MKDADYDHVGRRLRTLTRSALQPAIASARFAFGPVGATVIKFA